MGKFVEKSTKEEWLNVHRQIRIIGQKSAVSLVNIGDKIDIQRLMVIENDPRVREVMDFEGEAIDVKKWAKGSNSKIIFAIRGSRGVRIDEVGKLQGWIYFYPEDKKRLVMMTERGIVGKLPKDSLVFEVSFAKLPGAPRGQIASGLRQSLLLLTKRFEKNNPKVNMVYTRPIIIMSYVDPGKNPESVNVLLSTGFEKRGQLRYKEGSDKEDDVYVLNWDFLYKKLEKDATEELGLT